LFHQRPSVLVIVFKDFRIGHPQELEEAEAEVGYGWLHSLALWRGEVIAKGEFRCNLAKFISLEKRTNTLMELVRGIADPYLLGRCPGGDVCYAITSAHIKDGACQRVVAEIVKKLHMSNITLHWILRHADIEGNEEADRLAKAATRKGSEQPPRRKGIPWYPMRLTLEKANKAGEFPQHKTVETGMFTRKMDAAFHLGRSAELYRQLTSAEAAILLTQLRTGKTFLNEYLHNIKASDTAQCDCGSTESIAHFLFVARSSGNRMTVATHGYVLRAFFYLGSIQPVWLKVSR
jgi:hypothetical protein